MDRDKLQNLLDSLDEGPLGKSQLYWDRVNRALDLSSNPDILKERAKSISKNHKGKKNPNHGKKISKPIKAYKIKKANANKKSPIISEEYIGTYQSAYHAAEALGLYQADINNVLRPKSISKSTKGYTFKYVNND